MPLRPARYSDLTTLATLCSASFFDEDLFGQVMHPRRHEFPDDPALYWHQHIQNLWFDWRNQPFAAVTRDEKDGQEKIVGLAVWQRQGEGGKNMALSNVDPRKYRLCYSSLLRKSYSGVIYRLSSATVITNFVSHFLFHLTCPLPHTHFLYLSTTHPILTPGP